MAGGKLRRESKLSPSIRVPGCGVNKVPPNCPQYFWYGWPIGRILPLMRPQDRPVGVHEKVPTCLTYTFPREDTANLVSAEDLAHKLEQDVGPEQSPNANGAEAQRRICFAVGVADDRDRAWLHGQVHTQNPRLAHRDRDDLHTIFGKRCAMVEHLNEVRLTRDSGEMPQED